MTLESVRGRVAAACDGIGRPASEVTLVAVSKGRSVEDIARLYAAGQRDFGENRAQELRAKVPLLPSDIRWHFIGPLQSNKARTVRPAVVALHSMDRLSLGVAWMKGSGSPPPCYLEVNVGAEPQKSGFAPDELDSAAAQLVSIGVPLIGLMAIPPLTGSAEATRSHFAELRGLRDRVVGMHPQITGLSMGMTNDFEAAIEEGATVIRVGRAIFEG